MKRRRKISQFAGILILKLIIGIGATMAEEKVQEEKALPVFAFVPLNNYRMVTADQFRTAIRDAVGPTIKVDKIEIEEKSITARIDDKLVMIALLDRPIPRKDLEWAYRASWTWPDAAKAVKDHQMHLMVTVFDFSNSQLDNCLLLTKLLASTTQLYDCAGIYWGHASLLSSPEQIRTFAAGASTEKPPILAWVSFNRMESTPGTLSVGTEGLEYFGCRELEVVNSRRPIMEILNLLAGVAHILVKGEVISDGDTVGGEDELKEKIKTRYAKSVREGMNDVIRIGSE